MNTHISLPPSRPLFLKGKVKVLQNWVGAAIKKYQKLAISKKYVWEIKRGKAEEMQRS